MSAASTDTKQRILDTATNLFSCHGFSATSIDDILKGVGITKGAFYHYFKSKNHLCEIVLDCAIAEYQRLATTLQDGDESADLLQWCQILIEKQSSGQWLYYRLLTRLSIESTELDAVLQDKLRTFWKGCQAFYETLIQKTCDSQGIELPVSPQELARLLMATRFGAAWLDRSAPDTQDLVTVCETLLKLSLR